MDTQRIKEICAAMLFTSNKPLTLTEIKDVLGEVDSGVVKVAMDELVSEYDQQNKSFGIKQIAGGYIMVTHPEYSQWLKKLYKDKYTWRLSGPALETLAIVAYKQPITKAEVEVIRGVNADGVMSTLLERDLVKISGRKEIPGRPLLYSTTKDFLNYFGLNSLKDLPALEDIVVKQDDSQGSDGLLSEDTSEQSPEQKPESSMEQIRVEAEQ